MNILKVSKNCLASVPVLIEGAVENQVGVWYQGAVFAKLCDVFMINIGMFLVHSECWQ